MKFQSKKQRLAGQLGFYLSHLFRKRVQRLRKEKFTLAHNDQNYGLLDKLLRLGLLYEIIKNQDIDKLAQYHINFWQSDHAADYHRQSMAGNTLTSQFSDVFPLLNEYQKQFSITTLCEIGSGSGEALQEFKKQIAGIEKFIGIDLSEQTVDECNRKYRSTNTEFIAADANQWVLNHGEKQWLYVTHGGVLEYFPQDTLLSFFQHIKNVCSPSAFLLFEPVGVNYSFETSSHSEPYSGEFSFSHNYPFLLEKAGYNILYCERLSFSALNDFVCLLATTENNT